MPIVPKITYIIPVIITFLSIFRHRSSSILVNSFTFSQRFSPSININTSTSTRTTTSFFKHQSSLGSNPLLVKSSPQQQYSSSRLEKTFLFSTSTSTTQQSQTEELNKLTVVQIKEILREKGLKVSGRKADLIERLIIHQYQYIQSEGKEEELESKVLATMPRRSTRKRKNDGDDTSTSTGADTTDLVEKKEEEPNVKKANATKDKSPPKAKAKVPIKAKAKVPPKARAPPKAKAPAKKVKKAKVEPQRLTDRDELTKLWNVEEGLKKGSYTFKIMSWNVAGLRALMRKQPKALSTLASEHKLDVICLQETKLQEMHLEDPKLNITGLLADDGYDSHWSCSTAKKGYSGTCVFIKRQVKVEVKKGEEKETNDAKKKQGTLDGFFGSKKKSASKPKSKSSNDDSTEKEKKSSEIGEIDVQNLIPTNVSMKMDKDEHDSEGRIITVDFPEFSLSNLYVPNSGRALDRLDYRTESWDKDLLNFMKEKENTRKKPVIWLGDLNVAHTWQDTWNFGAKHLAKQPGTTAQEKASFQQMLDADDSNFVDAFRHLYPDAKGHYTYWSQMAGNKAPNKGLRLDYFICSKSMMVDGPDKRVTVRDSYMVKEQEGSDHCPVVLEIEMKK